MRNIKMRDYLLNQLYPHTQKRLTLSEVLNIFCSQVKTLKSYPFFIALFTFNIDNFSLHGGPTAEWVLEMAHENRITTEPVCSVVHGLSRAYISDPSIFLVDTRTLAYENIHLREHIARLLPLRTEEGKHLREHAVETIMAAPSKPFGFKIHTQAIGALLAPPITGSTTLESHVAPVTQDGCAACSML
jgi:hypothetical protein